MTIKGLFYISLAAVVLSCCKDKQTPPETTEFQYPSTYTFERDGVSTVSYGGQTDRLDMLGELVSYAKTQVAESGIIDAALLTDMYRNENAPFQAENLNQSSKNLESKTFILDSDRIRQYFDSLALSSLSIGQMASNGQAGVLISNDASKTYLVDANGMEWIQRIEKEIMGAVFYYQATSVYLSDDKIGAQVDNTNPVDSAAGKMYTTMEHHWDEAFGYLGVPIDFPSNTSDVRYHGKYCNSRNAVLGTNATLMNAFLKGRAATTAHAYDLQEAAVNTIQNTWELVIASTAIHYLNGALSDFSDDALRCHQLSEAVAFIRSLKYNGNTTLTSSDLLEWESGLGTNFYTISTTDIVMVRDAMATAFGLEALKQQI